MTCRYFAVRAGNLFSIGVGGSKLGEIWFKSEGESNAPLSETEAENIALKIVNYLNENHPISDEMAEEWGDSEESIKHLEFIDRVTKDEASKEDLFKAMLMSAMCGDEE